MAEEITNSKFLSDLKRSFKDIKASRAESVAEDVELVYKRKIEDICHLIRSCERQRENLILDLAPSNALSGAVVPSDFNATEFMNKDLEIGKKIHVSRIELEIIVDRYENLFGRIPDTTAVSKALPGWTSKLNN